MPSTLPSESVEEARRILARLADVGTEALLTVSVVADEQPGDKQVQQLLVRTMLDLDRALRLHAAFETRHPQD